MLLPATYLHLAAKTTVLLTAIQNLIVVVVVLATTNADATRTAWQRSCPTSS
jgi:hypothetical protein